MSDSRGRVKTRLPSKFNLLIASNNSPKNISRKGKPQDFISVLFRFATSPKITIFRGTYISAQSALLYIDS